MTIYWVSSGRMTFEVSVDERNIIRDTAPIGRKFIGQPLDNLARWMKRQGGFRLVKQH